MTSFGFKRDGGESRIFSILSPLEKVGFRKIIKEEDHLEKPNNSGNVLN
jgi:hypothetical protein